MTIEEIAAVAPTVRRLFVLFKILQDEQRTDEQRVRALDRFIDIAGIDNIHAFALARIARLYPTPKGK